MPFNNAKSKPLKREEKEARAKELPEEENSKKKKKNKEKKDKVGDSWGAREGGRTLRMAVFLPS